MSSSGKAIIEKLHFVMKHAVARKGFDQYLKDVSVLSASSGKVDFEMEVKHEHTNQGGTLHGGMTSSLVDTMTTLALMSTEDGTPGLSLNLGVNFLKAAKVGERIRIEAEVIKQGRTIAHTAAKIYNQKGDIIAVGSHVKHIGS